jgi:hypothetical protein
MTDFSKSFAYTLQVYEVDRVTWADKRLMGNFNNASVSKTAGRMVESANMTMDRLLGESFEEGYYRIVVKVTQDGSTERHDIATLYCTSVSGTVDHGVDEVTINGLSVLYPANGCVMDFGSYAPQGSDGAMFVKNVLSEVLHAPIEVHGSFQIADNHVFDLGAKRLDCAWDVLEAAGWCIQIDERGVVHIRELPSDPVNSTTGFDNATIASGVPYGLDWSQVPNRYIAFDGATLGVCVNDDPRSVVSTKSRGFVMDFDGGVDTNPVLVGGETLDMYCRRMLKSLSSVTHEVTKEREYSDGVYPYSVVRMVVQPTGETMDMRVTRREIRCGEDLTVTETYAGEVLLWD